MIETTEETFRRIDPVTARAVALESAARVGVTVASRNAVRGMPARDLSAKEWLRIALEVDASRGDDVEG